MRVFRSSWGWILPSLATLAGGACGAQSQRAGDVTESRVASEGTAKGNWLVNGGDFGANHYSPLTQITDRNVAKLGLAWSLDIDSPMGMASEPIVVDAVAYVSASLDRVFAVEAATGKLLWRFAPKLDLRMMRNSWAARTNRGVAVWEGKVFVGTGDCRMLALDAATGKQLWESPSASIAH